MNVSEAAAKYHVSRQAIYAHLNKVDNGRNQKTGQLTEAGEALLAEIYTSFDSSLSEVEQPASTIDNNHVNELEKRYETEISEQKQTIDQLRGQIDDLRALLEQTRNQLTAITGERDRFKADAERAAGELAEIKERNKQLDADLRKALDDGSQYNTAAQVANAQLVERAQMIDTLKGQLALLQETIIPRLAPVQEQKAHQEAAQDQQQSETKPAAETPQKPKKRHWWQW